jgi:hypothetical protein
VAEVGAQHGLAEHPPRRGKPRLAGGHGLRGVSELAEESRRDRRAQLCAVYTIRIAPASSSASRRAERA